MNIVQTIMPSVTILNAGTDVDINWADDYSDTEALTLQAPAVLAEVITFQGSCDGVAFATIADLTGVAVKGPTAGQMIIYNGVFSGLKTLRIHAAGAVAANRVFQIGKAWRGL